MYKITYNNVHFTINLSAAAGDVGACDHRADSGSSLGDR